MDLVKICNMKNFGVYAYHSKKLLGDFLSISTDNGTNKFWYLTPEGDIRMEYRENIEIKEIPPEKKEWLGPR